MSVTLIDPDGLPQVGVYKQVALSTGSRHVHIAGQVARDGDGNPVATDDLEGQVIQAFRNVGVALSSASSTFADVVRFTIYVVDWNPDKMSALLSGVARAAEELGMDPSPITLIGVAALFEPDVLVEVEATAVAE